MTTVPESNASAESIGKLPVLASQSELTHEDNEIWGHLWTNLYETYYTAYFEEMCGEHSIKFWKRFDAIVKIFQIVTAGGSAIAGWALWQKENFRLLWELVAGASAIIAAIHTALNISKKIEEDTLVYSEFKSVRVQAERLRSYMQIKAYERLSDYKREYADLLARFGTANSLQKPDFLFRKCNAEKIQDELNKKLGL